MYLINLEIQRLKYSLIDINLYDLIKTRTEMEIVHF